MKSKYPESNSEATRIADQLRRAFEGSAWHGPALLELLEDVDIATAAALRRLSGEKCQPSGLANFPLVTKPTESAWRKTLAETKRTHDTLVRTVAALPDSRLGDRVPGKRYDFYYMLHGIAQHELYHAGQIAILKKARGR